MVEGLTGKIKTSHPPIIFIVFKREIPAEIIYRDFSFFEYYKLFRYAVSAAKVVGIMTGIFVTMPGVAMVVAFP